MHPVPKILTSKSNVPVVFSKHLAWDGYERRAWRKNSAQHLYILYTSRTRCEKRDGKSISSLGNLTNNLGFVFANEVSLVRLRSLVTSEAGSRFRISQDKNHKWPILMNYHNQFTSIFAYVRYHYSFVQRIWMISSSLDGACFWRYHGIWTENFQQKHYKKTLPNSLPSPPRFLSCKQKSTVYKIKPQFSIWGFSKIGVPQNGWFIMENPINPWMIWGEPPLFSETSICLRHNFAATKRSPPRRSRPRPQSKSSSAKPGTPVTV